MQASGSGEPRFRVVAVGFRVVARLLLSLEAGFRAYGLGLTKDRGFKGLGNPFFSEILGTQRMPCKEVWRFVSYHRATLHVASRLYSSR